MGWKLLDRPKTMKLTAKLAQNFMEMESAPNDRTLSERRLAVYSKLLHDGQFRPVTWASALCKETEGLYRVNGKHTSTMFAGLKTLPDFFVTVEEYECDTLEDVAKLYATFDSALQSRNARDIYLSFAGTISELAAVPAKVVTAAVAGMAFQQYGTNLATTQPAERAENLLEYPEFVLWLAKLLGGANSSGNNGVKTRSNQKALHLYRAPVVAGMFGTWLKAKAAATEFWTAVRDETGAKPDLPDRKIARWLVTSTLSHREHGRVRSAGNRETYVKCLHAWNAWRRNEGTNLNYYAESKVPTVV